MNDGCCNVFSVIKVLFNASSQLTAQPFSIRHHEYDSVLIVGLEHDQEHASLLNDPFQGNVFCITQFSERMIDIMGLHEGDGDRVGFEIADQRGYDGVCWVGVVQTRQVRR